MTFQSKILVFSRADDKEQKGDRGAVTVPTPVSTLQLRPEEVTLILTAADTAARLVFCSQYCDLRDENNNLVATLTWTGNVQVRELKPDKVRSAAR